MRLFFPLVDGFQRLKEKQDPKNPSQRKADWLL